MVISNISKPIFPLGIVISATSPTLLPSKPFAIGVLQEILPALRSASLSGTIVYVTTALFFVLFRNYQSYQFSFCVFLDCKDIKKSEKQKAKDKISMQM